MFHFSEDKLSLIIAKYVDDILIASCNRDWMDWAVGGIRKAFDISSTTLSPTSLSVNSTEIEQTADQVVLTMRQYHRERLICLTYPRRGGSRSMTY